MQWSVWFGREAEDSLPLIFNLILSEGLHSLAKRRQSNAQTQILVTETAFTLIVFTVCMHTFSYRLGPSPPPKLDLCLHSICLYNLSSPQEPLNLLAGIKFGVW